MFWQNSGEIPEKFRRNSGEILVKSGEFWWNPVNSGEIPVKFLWNSDNHLEESVKRQETHKKPQRSLPALSPKGDSKKGDPDKKHVQVT